MNDITVLFVDDEKDTLSSLELNLVRESYRKLFAESAEAALEIMTKEPVHVVISDMRMPGMDGLAFLAKVRQQYPDTVRLMLSASTDVSMIIGSINTGEIFRYIMKPIEEPEEFKKTIQEAIAFYLVHREKGELVARVRATNQELMEGNARLRSLDRAKSEFVSIVSHELRTPLTSIIGFAQTLKNLELNDAQKKHYLDIIEEEGQRLARLIRDFLDISKIQMGRMELRITSVDIGTLLQEIVENFSVRHMSLIVVSPESLRLLYQSIANGSSRSCSTLSTTPFATRDPV